MLRARLGVLAVAAAALVACAAPRAAERPVLAPAPRLELVESSPIETNLDHADIPDAKDVWLEMIRGATATLDFAEFYASNAPNSRLEAVVLAVEDALKRGVRIRFLADEKFYATYPDTLERLAAKGVQLRRYNGKELLGGGVLHAKYFLVDGREAYLGSQNFDWRSLEHIQELGLRVRVPEVIHGLADVFETDWALAGGAPKSTRIHQQPATETFPVTLEEQGAPARVTLAYSPRGSLPDESLWDLPRLVELIDSAKRTVRVQLLTYHAKPEEGSASQRLEAALKRAAARGVKVELLLADWSKRDQLLPGLRALHAPPGLTVKTVTIPRWSGGDVPFARVIHAKYMVVDGERCWVGTSNWEESYFTESRNVGLIVENAPMAQRLDRFFTDGWNGPYATPIAP